MLSSFLTCSLNIGAGSLSLNPELAHMVNLASQLFRWIPVSLPRAGLQNGQPTIPAPHLSGHWGFEP